MDTYMSIWEGYKLEVWEGVTKQVKPGREHSLIK